MSDTIPLKNSTFPISTLKSLTPSIDFLDVFLMSSKASELFKVADISTGEMLSLRSDFTPQIARLSSALKNSV
ncbi:MAG: ATP phosphoribosyltransferase regulatory subunit, partial [Deltaproteobacteria bacterium]|nr:ATP phosphoribosyltransferase regulatory subunit [Deltaproteobacteria bacterium]